MRIILYESIEKNSLIIIQNNMERHEYEDDTIPQHVAHHLRQVAQDKAIKALERKEKPHMDNDEMNEIERWQQFIWYNFLR